MLTDVSQVSRALDTSASGHDANLGFSRKNTGHNTKNRTPLRRFKVGAQLGPAVLSLVATQLRPAVRAILESTGTVNGSKILDSEKATQSAVAIRCGINAARTAFHAYCARGQLAAWRTALRDLPTGYTDAVDYLEVFAARITDSLRADVDVIGPTIASLNAHQPSPTKWARPVSTDVQRGRWTGRAPWIAHADDYTAPLTSGPGKAISDHNRMALLEAIASFVDQNGHNLTASHQTIAQVAIDRYGCTLARSTATQRLKTLRRLLKRGGFVILHENGGWLKSYERLAAEVHHGGNQAKCAATCDLNLPEHLRPTPPPKPTRPNYAQQLTTRLVSRDRRTIRKSPYTVGCGLHSSLGDTWVAHPRVHAREHTTHSPLRREAPTPSLRDWRIADDLTRHGAHSAAENGPYAHLVGSAPSQVSRKQLATLIATLTPQHIDTTLLLRGLAHAATSRSTGYIALGLSKQPRNALAWMTTILRNIDWTQTETFPSWSTTAQAFGIDWRGHHHAWTPKPDSPHIPTPHEPTATAPQRAAHMTTIRRHLEITGHTSSHQAIWVARHMA